MRTADDEARPALLAYPADCQPIAIESLGGAGGFSGARLWRITAPRGRLCLRQWPAEHPTQERLVWIDRVLWHVEANGFRLAPTPIRTVAGQGFVEIAGRLWELTPWMPGAADLLPQISDARITAAMTALARFHLTAETFSDVDGSLVPSPGLAERRRMLEGLLAGGIDRIARAIDPKIWPGCHESALGIVLAFRERAETFGHSLERVLATTDSLRVRLQPAIRDIHRDHILFEGDMVTGVVDFGSMRMETVAADVARLLGSLANDQRTWQLGLAAYETSRPLSEAERTLAPIFDHSAALLGGVQWLEWLYVARRSFEAPDRVEKRLCEFVVRAASSTIASS